MFKIENNTMHITRCNKGTIELVIPGYTFAVGDTVELRIYEKKGLDKPPIKTKEIEVTKPGASLDIHMTCEDTDIGTPDNKMVEYWYEVELNDEQTVIGFDDDTGAKILNLYPKGVEDDETES